MNVLSLGSIGSDPVELHVIIHGLFVDFREFYKSSRLINKQTCCDIEWRYIFALWSRIVFILRIYCEDKQTFLQDCEDDGETAAGGRLLHLMQVKGISW